MFNKWPRCVSCDVLRNLSCIVLRVMRENHRRGQKQGNQKAGEGEGNSNTGAQTTGAEREREGRGDGFASHIARTVRAQTEGAGEGRRGGDRVQGGRTPHGQVQGVTSGAGQGVPRIVSRVVPVVINWPEVVHGCWAYCGA